MARKLKCPKCKSADITVTLVTSGSKMKHKGLGLGGHVNNAARAAAGVMTLGASNLVWRKSHGSTDTKVESEKIAICQSCGYDWEV